MSGLTEQWAPSGVQQLLSDACREAVTAMERHPAPNYTITKIAEEAGEVVKAAVHCAEGRDTPEHVLSEVRQAIAMLVRLVIEGDQVHGLPPLLDAQVQRPAAGTVKPLEWEQMDADSWRAPAPFFGNFRVHNYGRGFEACWSVTGLWDTFIAGQWPDAAAAKAAVDDEYERRMRLNVGRPRRDGLPKWAKSNSAEEFEDLIRGLIGEAVVWNEDQEREDEGDAEICRISEGVLDALRPFLVRFCEIDTAVLSVRASIKEDLLPCPFCGGRSVSVHGPKGALGAWVACTSCGLETPTETCVTIEQAFAYWNRRAPAPTMGGQ